MFQFYAENHDDCTGDRDLAKVRELNPYLESFESGSTCTKTTYEPPASET
jgi:hypothetical protein